MPATTSKQIRVRRALLPLLAIAASLPLPAQHSATEEQVRSAFLFQLAQFVNWPAAAAPTSGRPWRFCVFEDDGLAAILDPVVRGKRIEGRAIEAVRISSASKLQACHLAFVGLTKDKELKEFFASWKYPPVLLVGQGELFVRMGGMVALTIESGRVSFALNLDSTRQADLSVRSQLLRFARILSSGEGK